MTIEEAHENAALAARLRADKFPDHLRRWAITDALGYIVDDQPDEALRRLTESVLGEQARAAGIRVSA